MSGKKLPSYLSPSGSCHPIRKGTWSGYRQLLDYYGYVVSECDFCGGRLSHFEHETEWDFARRYHADNGVVGYIWMPPWFPTSVCPECAEYLTPFVYTLSDIGLLRLYSSKLERIVTHVRNRKDDTDPLHWTTAFAACERRSFGIGRFTRNRESGDVEQAFKEHQRQSLFGDKNCNVSQGCGDKTDRVRPTSDWRPEGRIKPASDIFPYPHRTIEEVDQEQRKKLREAIG